MFGNRNYKIKDYNAINARLNKQVLTIYQYRFKDELAELSRINARRNELFDSVARKECTEAELIKYRELNDQRLEIEKILSRGKDKIKREVFGS